MRKTEFGASRMGKFGGAPPFSRAVASEAVVSLTCRGHWSKVFTKETKAWPSVGSTGRVALKDIGFFYLLKK